MDLQNRDVVTVMIVESAGVVDEVTELAEKCKKLAPIPWKVNLQEPNWAIQVTRMKTEVNFLLGLMRSAAAIRRGEIYSLQWVMEPIHAARLSDECKSTLTAKKLGIVLD